jgi:hypothetical protein
MLISRVVKRRKRKKTTQQQAEMGNIFSYFLHVSLALVCSVTASHMSRWSIVNRQQMNAIQPTDSARGVMLFALIDSNMTHEMKIISVEVI